MLDWWMNREEAVHVLMMAWPSTPNSSLTIRSDISLLFFIGTSLIECLYSCGDAGQWHSLID
jgi:hypothetical protein